jgi:hypothetical protein
LHTAKPVPDGAFVHDARVIPMHLTHGDHRRVPQSQGVQDMPAIGQDLGTLPKIETQIQGPSGPPGMAQREGTPEVWVSAKDSRFKIGHIGSRAPEKTALLHGLHTHELRGKGIVS